VLKRRARTRWAGSRLPRVLDSQAQEYHNRHRFGKRAGTPLSRVEMGNPGLLVSQFGGGNKDVQREGRTQEKEGD